MFKLNTFNSGQPQALSVDYGQISFLINAAFGNQAWSALVFNGALATVWFGHDGDAFANYRQIWQGPLGDIQRDDDQNAHITLSGPEGVTFNQNLLSLTYAGTGGAEGTSDITGTLKPYAYGACTNVQPTLIDATNWIYQVDGYDACPVNAVYELALTLGAPVSTNSTSYAQLQSLTLAAGQWASAPAVGMFRLGSAPSGTITADVGASGTVGGFVTSILTALGIASNKIDASVAAVSAGYSFYSTDQATILDTLQAAALAGYSYIIADSAQKFYLASYASNKTPGNLTSNRSTLPLVRPNTIAQAQTTAQAWQVKIGHTPVYYPMSGSDISPAVATLGANVDALNTAAQNAQDAADAAQASADVANSRLTSMAADDVLDRTDKAALSREMSTIIAEKPTLVSTGSGLGITTEVTNYSNAYTTLYNYITGLSPAYNDTTQDTSIAHATFNNNFSAYYAQRQNLDNAIANKTATLASWTGVTNRPTDLTSLNATDGGKLSGIAAGATKNIITTSSTAPSSPADGDVWVDTSATPSVTKVRVSGAWVIGASYGAVLGSSSGSIYNDMGHAYIGSDLVTSQGTAADTSKVNGVPSTTITSTLNTITANPNLDTVAPATPAGLAISSTLNAQNLCDVTFTWTANTETDLQNYDLAVGTGGGALLSVNQPTTNSFILRGILPNTAIQAKVRAKDQAGNWSAYSAVVSATSTRDTTAPAVATGLSATASFGAINLAWTNASDGDLTTVQIWEGSTSSSSAAVMIATVNAVPGLVGGFARSGLATGVTRYYWLKSVDSSLNASAFSASVSATTASIANTDLASGLSGFQKVSSLPAVSGYTGPSLVLLSTDNKLYRYTGTAWTTAVPTTDLSGTVTGSQIASSTVTSTNLAANSVTSTQIATGAVGSGALASGAVNNAAISSGAIDSTKLAANSVTSAALAPSSVTTAAIVDAAIASAKLATNAVTPSKLAVGDVANYIQDPSFQDAAYWSLGTGAVFDTTTTTALTAMAVNSCVRWTPNGTTTQSYVTASLASGQRFSVEGGAAYRISASYYITTNFTGSLYIQVSWYKADGVTAASTALSVSNAINYNATASTAGSSGALTSIVTAPADALYCNFQLVNHWSTTLNSAGQAYMGYPIMNRATGNELLADGAVTTSKIVSGAVTATQMAANSVTSAAMVDSAVTAAKIATGAVTSDGLGSGAVTAAAIGSAAIDATKLASNLKGVEVVSSLPSSGNVAGRTVYLSTDGKLYRYNGSAWTSAVAAVDLTGQVTSGQIGTGAVTSTQIAGGAVGSSALASGAVTSAAIAANAVTANAIASAVIDNTKLINNLAGVEYVTSLPTTGNFSGRMVVLSTDGKLYRYVGSAFTSVVPATDVTGTLTGSQIGSNTITGTHIVDGSVATAELAANAVTAAKIAANTITAGQIAANTITSGQIAANTITTGQIAAGTITTSNMAANSITASKLNVADVTNYVLDPNFTDTAYWSLTSGTFVTATTDATAVNAMAVNAAFKSSTPVTSSPSSMAVMNGSQKFSVEGGASYRFNFQWYVTAGFTGLCWGRIYWYKADGSTLATGSPVNFQPTDYRTTAASAATAGSYNTITTAPTDAFYGLVWFQVLGSTTLTNAGTGYIGYPILQRANAGELTVDGSITAAKIAAGTITGDRIAANTIQTGQLGAGAVTATQIAANTITAGQIAAGTIGATQLAANSVTTNQLAANAVTAAKIAANTITSGQIAANTITAGQIASGTITATQLAANSVTASKLFVGDVANYVQDPNFSDAAYWSLTNGAFVTSSTDSAATTAMSVTSAAKTTAVGSSMAVALAGGQNFSIEGGATYRINFSTYVTAGFTGTMYITVYFYDATGAQVSTVNGGPGPGYIDYRTTAASAAVAASQNWTTVAPTTALSCRIVLNCSWSTTLTNAGTGYIGYPIFNRAADGSLIVDGSVTASKIAAGSITADRIGAGQIGTTQLAANAVTATNIAAGTITADRLAANTLTANQIAVGTLSPNLIYNGSADVDNLGSMLGWYTTEGSAFTSLTQVATSITGMGAYRFNLNKAAAATACAVGTRPFQVVPGQKYLVTWTDGCDAATSSGKYARIFYGASMPASGQLTQTNRSGFIDMVAGNSAWAAGPNNYSYTWTCPSGVHVASFVIYDWPNGPLNVYLDNVSVVCVSTGATIIGPNTITADSLAANSITATQIAANTITAGQIAAGTVTANEIAANTITAAKIASSTITGTQIAGSTITGSNIAGTTITGSNIVSGTLTSTQIAAGSITGDRLTANTITAGQIATGTITANNMAANSITASKLVVGDVANYIQDPNFSDPAYWSLANGAFSTTDTTPMTAMAVQRVLKTTTVGTSMRGQLSSGQMFSIEGNVAYRCNMAYYAPSGFTGAMYFLMNWYKADGVTPSSTPYNIVFISVDGRTTALTSAQTGSSDGMITAPGDALFAVPALCVDWSSTLTNAGTAYFGYPVVNRAVGTNLIVDGSILATKLAANTITANQIASGTITGTQIAGATITGGNIAGNSIVGGHIQANTITATNIAANTITANQIAAGTIQAAQIASGTITGTQIAGSTITGSNIAGTTITGANMVAGTITTDKIAAGTITGDRLNSTTSLPATLTIGTTGFNLQTVQQLANSGVLSNNNSNFTDWSGTYPANYALWSGSPTVTKVAGLTYPNALRVVGPSGADSGVYSGGGNAPWTLKASQWIVLTATVILNSGTFVGAGILVRGNGTGDCTIRFAVDPDNTGAVIGNGTTGQSYTFTKVMQAPSGANTASYIYLMQHWSTFGANTTANDITWIQAGWRPASSVEINPANQINANTTTINPGNILISGSTTLSNWRNGSDTTKIEGGSIAANTITSNKLTIGNRNISITGIDFQAAVSGTLTWTSGTISYINSAGSVVSVNTSAGSVTNSGCYIYWTEGATSLSANTSAAVANADNAICLCAWRGGVTFNATYGGTIIDGSRITTGTVTATQIAAGTITATQIAGSTITGDRIAGGTITGDKISSSTSLPSALVIGSTGFTLGTVQSIAAQSTGPNRIPFSLFEGNQQFGSPSGGDYPWWAPAYNPSSLAASGQCFGFNGHQLQKVNFTATAANQFLSIEQGVAPDPVSGTTNIKYWPRVTPGEAIWYGAYVETANCTVRIQLTFYQSNGSTVSTVTPTVTTGSFSAAGFPSNANSWEPWRQGGFALVPSDAAFARMQLYSTSTASGTGFFSVAMPMLCGIVSGTTIAPPFNAGPTTSNPAMVINSNTTTIAGGMITTGTITANQIAATTITTDRLVDNSVTASMGIYVSTQFTGQGTPSGSNGNTGVVGDGSGGGSGGGVRACVHVASFMPHGGVAGDVVPGTRLLLLNRGDDTGYHEEECRAMRKGFEPCYRITTASGITLVCSESTPITTYNDVSCDLLDALGVDVPVLDQGVFRWEPITAIDPVGDLEIILISAGNGVYAAGEHDDGRYIFTHNGTVKP